MDINIPPILPSEIDGIQQDFKNAGRALGIAKQLFRRNPPAPARKGLLNPKNAAIAAGVAIPGAAGAYYLSREKGDFSYMGDLLRF